MTKTRNGSSLHWVLVAALVVAGAGFAQAASDEDDEPKTPLERIDRSMFTIQQHIRNADARIRNKVVGSSRSGAGSGASFTATCCSGNIEFIRKAITKIEKNLDEIDACYRRGGLSEARSNLATTRADLGSLSRGLGHFREAGGEAEARGAHGGMSRAFLLIRDDLEKLPECGATSAP